MSNATYRDSFVSLREHGDEHVDKHNDHARAVRSKHEFADELRQIVTLVDSENVDRRQSVHGEVQRLNDLEQAAHMHSYIPHGRNQNLFRGGDGVEEFSSIPSVPFFTVFCPPFFLPFPRLEVASNPGEGFGERC